MFQLIVRYVSLALLAAAVPAVAQGQTVVGRVAAVTDGDSLLLVDGANQQHKIRLAGIDSPEKTQDFGQKAKTRLSALAFDQQASADCRKQGNSQNEICVVTVAGKDLGLELIRSGLAWWYRDYAEGLTPQQRADYEQAELMAKIQRQGLWNSQKPIAPWNWRRGRLDE